MSINKQDTEAIILSHNVSFKTWSSDLMGALAKEKLVGYVFHNLPNVRAKPEPENPHAPGGSPQHEEYLDRLEAWSLNDMNAYSIILRRLDPSIRPETNSNMTACELYNMVAETHKPSMSLSYAEALDRLIDTKFDTNATEYCTNSKRIYKTVARPLSV